MHSQPAPRLATKTSTGYFTITDAARQAARRELRGARIRHALFAGIGSLLREVSAKWSGAPRQHFASKASYYRHCKEVLTRALAPYWQGSRSALKQRVRAWLRSRRQDVSLLGGVLRAAVVPGALVLMMLAISATAQAEQCGFHYEPVPPSESSPLTAGALWPESSAPVFCNLDGDLDSDVVVIQADGSLRYFEHVAPPNKTAYTEREGAANPLNGIVLGEAATLSFGDLDDDTDLDMVAGGADGEFRYFENTGTLQIPSFVQRTGVANPFDGQEVGQLSAPCLGDMDDDGDLDAVSGNYQGYIFYLKNTGTPEAGVFEKQPNLVGNPFYVLAMLGGDTRPTLGDIDDDGDLDILVGGGYGVLRFGRNIGTPQTPAFDISSNPFSEQDLGYDSAPSFADMDADGDLDLLVGATNFNVVLQRVESKIAYFKNTGTPLVPAFGNATALGPVSGASSGRFGSPGLVDIDGDSDLDLFIGDFYNKIYFYRNELPDEYNGFSAPSDVENPLFDVDLGRSPDPQFADLNGDGKQDAIIGNGDGNLFFLKNVGSTTEPNFELQAGASNPFEGIDVGTFCTPALADLDADEDIDIIAGDGDGIVHYFRNTGSKLVPEFEEQSGTNNPADGITTEGANNPALADVNDDGLMDLLLGLEDGRAVHYENIGSTESPMFAATNERANPFGGVNVGGDCAPAIGDIDLDGSLDAVFSNRDGRVAHFAPVPSDFFAERGGADSPLTGFTFTDLSAPALVDLDDDTDQDLVVRSANGVLRYLENIGTPLDAFFTERTGSANPLDGINPGGLNVPKFADLDDDGDPDFISGGDSLMYFENVGLPQAAAFEQRLGGENPFSSIEGTELVPTFADMDADGDLDLFVGSVNRDLRYFENSGTTLAPAFGGESSQSQFSGVEFYYRTAPDLSDVDSDGDFDLLIGLNNGVIFYENIGDPESQNFLRQPGGLASYFANLFTGDYSIPACADMDGDDDVDAFVGAVDGRLRYYEHFPPDCEAPTAVCGGIDVELGENGDVNVSGFRIDAGSSDNVGVLSIYVSPGYFTCGEIGEQPVTLTVEDVAGNQATCDTTLRIVDSAPQIVIAPETTASCGVPYQEAAPFAFGVCGASYEVQVTGTVDTSIPGPYLLTYSATNSNGDVATTSKTVTVSDSEGPVIAAVTPTNVSCGGAFVDVPPSATDLCEGDVPVQTSGSVDTSTPGQYTLTYTAADSEGNEATPVTRTVTVLNNCSTGGVTYGDVLEGFAEADVNDDSLLTLEEIQALLPSFTQQNFNDADANNDGKLSVPELLQALGGGVIMSADTNADRVIQLSELLRLIQLYNAGRYYCAENSGSTEDGFTTAPPLNEPDCVTHSSDKNGDKALGLSELLRGIQFFNLEGYTYCEEESPEDGFCAP